MTQDPQQFASMFSIDVAADSSTNSDSSNAPDAAAMLVGLMRQLVAGQDRQNELLEEMMQQMNATQRQRSQELHQWKEANPQLARDCRHAAETLSKVQTEFLRRLTDEVSDNAEHLVDGEFLLTEFVDRFGPRLAHLNGVLQVLSQLSTIPNANPPKA